MIGLLVTPLICICLVLAGAALGKPIGTVVVVLSVLALLLALSVHFHVGV